jgi:hypothetical protein
VVSGYRRLNRYEQRLFSQKMKPIVRLWSLVGAGLIIPRSTGIIYTNQTDGYACDHPSLEGAFIPLSNDFDHENYHDSLECKLCEIFPEGWGAPTPEICDQVDHLLGQYPETSGIRIDRDKMDASREAWIWVLLEEDDRADFQGFGNCSAILTWPNSD